jgi:hypothetical protein
MFVPLKCGKCDTCRLPITLTVVLLPPLLETEKSMKFNQYETRKKWLTDSDLYENDRKILVNKVPVSILAIFQRKRALVSV